MHRICCALKREVGKPLLHKQNSKVTFHVPGLSTLQFLRQKDSLSFVMPLPSRAFSHVRGHLRVSHVLLDGPRKNETLLVV